MASEKQLEYIKFKEQFDEAEQNLHVIMATINKVVKALEDNPSNNSIAVIKIGGSGGTEVKSAKNIIDSETWPTSQQILDTLAKRNIAKQKAQQVYNSLSDLEKKNIVKIDSM